MIMEGRIIKLILMLILLIDIGRAKKKPKPIIINYDSEVEICDDYDSRAMMSTKGLKPVRINETTAKLEGPFELKQTIDNWMMTIVIEKKTALGSREIMLTHEISDLCAELAKRDENTMYSIYMRTIKIPNCPVEPGKYEIKDMIADTQSLPVFSIPQGTYYLTFTFFHKQNDEVGGFFKQKGKKIGCLSFVCIVEPTD